MVTALRTGAIFIEVTILMGIIYAFFVGARLTIFDFGIDHKYQKFINLSLIIIGYLALIFFISHLITFYPRILP